MKNNKDFESSLFFSIFQVSIALMLLSFVLLKTHIMEEMTTVLPGLSYTTYTIEDRIARVTLNRPEKRNAFSPELVKELTNIFEDIKSQDTVKVVILKAAGKVFCAGADLGYLQSLQTNTYDENLADSLLLKSLFRKIYRCPKVVIAQVQGHALAGGCGLATICDFVYAVPEAKFGYTEVKIGFVPALVMCFLVRKIGEGKTRELLLSGDPISAEEALRYGLISKIVDENILDEEVTKFATHLCQTNSIQSIALTKQMIINVQDMHLDDALNYAAESNARARGSADCKKGIAAFLNKEPLEW